jgi:hypothetical protein
MIAATRKADKLPIAAEILWNFLDCQVLAASPPSDWSVKRRIEYVEFAWKVVAGLRGINSQLEEQFDEAARAADRSFRPAL